MSSTQRTHPDHEASQYAPGKWQEVIRKVLGSMYDRPDFSVTGHPGKVEVARSDDIGYVLGTYEATMNDPKGNPRTDKGKYIEIWKKQADGSWKGAADILNSDLPAGGMAE
ncbi:MAG: DUF4440 domain-containing protein [Planctomycetes bacterium]|nr:DUF4440 domain-containing protein [Planctomycetota bacterium]